MVRGIKSFSNQREFRCIESFFEGIYHISLRLAQYNTVRPNKERKRRGDSYRLAISYHDQTLKMLKLTIKGGKGGKHGIREMKWEGRNPRKTENIFSYLAYACPKGYRGRREVIVSRTRQPAGQTKSTMSPTHTLRLKGKRWWYDSNLWERKGPLGKCCLLRSMGVCVSAQYRIDRHSYISEDTQSLQLFSSIIRLSMGLILAITATFAPLIKVWWHSVKNSASKRVTIAQSSQILLILKTAIGT